MRIVEHTVRYKGVDVSLAGPAGDHQTRAWQQGVFYEIGLLSWLSERSLASGFVLDVGACFGNHTLFFSIVMQRRVVAVEPWPANLKCLRRSIRLNPRADVTIIRAACNRVQGRLPMVCDHDDNFGMARVAAHGRFIPALTIDFVVGQQDQPPAFVKIDVEGHAEAVLEGAMETLNTYRPLVACECIGEEREAVDVVMQRAGYRRRPETFNATPTFIYEPND